MEGLFEYFMKNPQKLTNEYAEICRREGVERAAIDYISGMTDHFAIVTYNDIYIPKSWSV